MYLCQKSLKLKFKGLFVMFVIFLLSKILYEWSYITKLDDLHCSL